MRPIASVVTWLLVVHSLGIVALGVDQAAAAARVRAMGFTHGRYELTEASGGGADHLVVVGWKDDSTSSVWYEGPGRRSAPIRMLGGASDLFSSIAKPGPRVPVFRGGGDVLSKIIAALTAVESQLARCDAVALHQSAAGETCLIAWSKLDGTGVYCVVGANTPVPIRLRPTIADPELTSQVEVVAELRTAGGNLSAIGLGDRGVTVLTNAGELLLKLSGDWQPLQSVLEGATPQFARIPASVLISRAEARVPELISSAPSAAELCRLLPFTPGAYDGSGTPRQDPLLWALKQP